jgi:hypothetical protein
MNADFAILLFWFGISVTANVGMAIAWFRSSRRVRQLEARHVDFPQLDDLASRVEQAVDGLTARVDELASGQDFLNRVLGDRLDKLARPPQ